MHASSARLLARSTSASTTASLRQASSILPRASPLPSSSLAPRAPHISTAPRLIAPRRQIRALAGRAHLRSFHVSSIARAPAPQDFNLSDVGEGIVEVEIIKWFVKEGDEVAEFDPVCEVQSDKASVEITSRYAGKIVELCHKVGDVARVGKPLCKIEMAPEEGVEEDEQPAAATSEQAQSSSADASAGPSSAAAAAAPQAPRSEKPLDQRALDRREANKTLATPAVRRMTKEHNIDIASIQGTGKEGRVLKEDVVAAVERRSAGGAQEASEEVKTTASGGLSSNAGTSADEAPTKMPLTPMRRAMFRAMTSTWAAPHFGYSEEVDVTALDALRKEIMAATGTRLTLLAFLVKAMSLAMEEHPIFRSTLSLDAANPGAAELVTRKTHDISIALSSPHGLVTPTLPDARGMSILDVASHISSLQTSASGPKGLSRSELGLRSGTVTLSNIGSVGGIAAAPLLPPTGQLVIGALGRARYLPRYLTPDCEMPTKRLVLPASFSADHRVVEGTELANLVRDWKVLCETPGMWWAKMR